MQTPIFQVHIGTAQHSVSLRANRRRIMVGFEAYLKNDSGMEIVPGNAEQSLMTTRD